MPKEDLHVLIEKELKSQLVTEADDERRTIGAQLALILTAHFSHRAA